MDIEHVIISYLDGVASLDEKVYLLQWLKQSEENRSDFFQTRDLWIASDVALGNEIEVDIALEKFRSRLENNKLLGNKRKNTKLVSLSRFFKQAVAIFILLIVTGIFLHIYRSKNNQIVHSVYITSPSSKGNFILPDGSSVWLNINSKLTFTEAKFVDNRSVKLEGEAYFDVVHNKQAPFKVDMGDIEIEVLGTSFNASNYESESTVETTLTEGAIKLNGKSFHSSVILKAGDRFLYNKKTAQNIVNQVNPDFYSVWKQPQVIFDNRPLTEIVTCLEVWYQVSIDCPRNFSDTTYLSFTIKDETIVEILDALELIAPIKYTKKNNEIEIKQR